mmetsp:Transcript_14108/g.39930  ORF Transcript_14108/g.39930 Transcript_14108/m.39930 type:complete len:207 (-) Transcript_14108:105-725(-)
MTNFFVSRPRELSYLQLPLPGVWDGVAAGESFLPLLGVTVLVPLALALPPLEFLVCCPFCAPFAIALPFSLVVVVVPRLLPCSRAKPSSLGGSFATRVSPPAPELFLLRDDAGIWMCCKGTKERPRSARRHEEEKVGLLESRRLKPTPSSSPMPPTPNQPWCPPKQAEREREREIRRRRKPTTHDPPIHPNRTKLGFHVKQQETTT